MIVQELDSVEGFFGGALLKMKLWSSTLPSEETRELAPGLDGLALHRVGAPSA